MNQRISVLFRAILPVAFLLPLGTTLVTIPIDELRAGMQASSPRMAPTPIGRGLLGRPH